MDRRLSLTLTLALARARRRLARQSDLHLHLTFEHDQSRAETTKVLTALGHAAELERVRTPVKLTDATDAAAHSSADSRWKRRSWLSRCAASATHHPE